ncbi:MAG: DUF4091 domain-containing protein [Eubacteriales bacterium]|nr:DUF4091 domain-containing protein [Eubacteriales bacterium]MDY4008942.1 DUF4091 domain-containing protein [Candidatus Limiplasma sp.]
MITYRFGIAGSLEKILPQAEPTWLPPEHMLSGMRGETVSLQIGYTVTYRHLDLLEEKLRFFIRASEHIKSHLRREALMPVRLPCYADHDQDYLTLHPAMLPDLLLPYEAGGVRPVCDQWRALWIDLLIAPHCPAGNTTLEIGCMNQKEEVIWSERRTLRVIPCALPKQKLIHTEWFHTDCLADYYHIPVFSAVYWTAVENYVACAVKHGVNMLLTPIFTPPLDTAIGGERTTVQLLDIALEEHTYTFDFTKLDRWLSLCEKHGVQYFEIAHFFTQWGAKFAPKVLICEHGLLTKAFGWETQATEEAYQAFLRQLIPALVRHLKAKGVLDRCYFHISDEPHLSEVETYRMARESILPLLKGCHVIDALSSYEVYRQGVIPNPIVSNDHIHTFIEAGVEHLWTYYCCVQGQDVANRFIAMPSRRNRILGVQLYLYKIEGFLHWGFNFYNSQRSVRPIDPFANLDADESFPAGDPFLVYPGPDYQPMESVRIMVLSEALNDLKALERLEQLTSRLFVEALIEEEAGMKITFRAYPRSDAFLYRLRNRVNLLIEERLPG